MAKTNVAGKSATPRQKSGLTSLFMLGMVGILLLSALFTLGVGNPGVIY